MSVDVKGLGWLSGLSPERRKLYHIWRQMRQRCSNPSRPYYRHYGGRGIRVCDLWEKSFAAFERDMGPRPSPKHSIDRIDNDKGYEPGNCRWATPKEQTRNRSNVRLNAELAADIRAALRRGESRMDIAARYDINPRTVSNIKHGRTWATDDLTAALTTGGSK